MQQRWTIFAREAPFTTLHVLFNYRRLWKIIEDSDMQQTVKRLAREQPKAAFNFVLPMLQLCMFSLITGGAL